MSEKNGKKHHDAYPPISDYGFIADCHSSALVSSDGSIDWCCMPRIDSASCFGRLLGRETGGYCQIAPSQEFKNSRSYLDNTLILETIFQTEKGEARLLDFFPLRSGGRNEPHQQLIRIMEGISGMMELSVDIFPRFEYGEVFPWIRKYKGGSFIALAGSDGLLFSCDFPLQQPDRHCLTGRVTVSAGERKRLSIIYRKARILDDETLDPPAMEEIDHRLDKTIRLWNRWAGRGRIHGPHAALVLRSSLVLKGLSHAPTGAIAAAATTSLPEAPGGRRNWDYRYSWIRDSVFTLRSLADIGYRNEADQFRRFVERSAAGSASELQIMFGVGGERRLEEYRLSLLEGYKGARPVRIGNAAFRQTQLDMYGELLDLAWQWHQGGCSPDDDYWEFLVGLVKDVSRNWLKKDHGIWEMRGKRKHFVFSKAMCWSAVDKGILLAEDLGREAPVNEWRRLRDKIGKVIEESGYDRKRGVFVQHFGGSAMDAALLRLPMTGYIAYDDPRMTRTVDAIRDELTENGLLRRYAASSDGFEEPEGVFLACSFWLAECLARQGRAADAWETFRVAVSTGNDLGLFSEQYDPAQHEMRGNFPQGLTHLSLITAAIALGKINPGEPAISLPQSPLKERKFHKAKMAAR